MNGELHISARDEALSVNVWDGGFPPVVANTKHDVVRWLWLPKNAAAVEDVRNAMHRTALDTSNSSALVTAQSVDAGLPTFGSRLLSAVRRKPARASTVSAAQFGTEILAEELAEGDTYTGAAQTFTSSGQLPPKHAYADVPVSRQWLQQTADRSMVDRGLEVAVGRLMESHIGALLASSTAIATSAMSGAPAAPTRAKLAELIELAASSGVAPDEGVFLVSPKAFEKCANTQENGIYLASGSSILDRPAIVSAGIPENLGSGTNETCILFGDPLAISMWLWGVYTIEDKYTKARKGLVELAMGSFYRAVVPQPTRLKRLTGIATS